MFTVNLIMEVPMTRAERKKAAMEEVLAGLKAGTIKIEVITQCGWCRKKFNSDEAYEAHLITGKTMDPETGQRRRICPN
jgi:hypothetical protein